jgi:cutinase
VVQTAVQKLSPQVKAKLLGAALFGDTLNQRNRHKIPGYPAERVKEFCANGDGICEAAFRGITAAHLSYGSNGMSRQAVNFLVSKIRNNGGGERGGEVKGGGGKSKGRG